MRISVVLPVYNREKSVARAVDSVLGQGIEVEFIVVDDGSTDNTPGVLEKYGSRLVVLRQENQGPAQARNLGISRATGEVIAFIDSDDQWLPGKLAAQVKVFSDHPHVGLVATSADYCLDGETVKKSGLGPGLVPAEKYFWDNPFVTSTIMVRSIYLHSLTSWFRPDLDFAEDWELWIRLGRICPIYFLPQSRVRYHLSPDSLHRSAPAASIMQTYSDMYHGLLKDPVFPKDELTRRKIEVNVGLLTAYELYGRGDLSGARKIFQRSLDNLVLFRKKFRLGLVLFLPEKVKARLEKLKAVLA